MKERGEYKGKQKPPGVTLDSIQERVTYLTQNGRPTRELAADKSIIAQQKAKGVPFILLEHSFSDSRSEKPEAKMNISAFTEITKDKKAFFDGLAWLNYQYFGEEKPTEVTAHQAYELAVTGTYLPEYLVLRANDAIPKDGLPDIVGNVSKACAGVESSTVLLGGNLMSTRPLVAKDIFAAADEAALKPLSYGEQVCPAPASLITQSSNVLLFRSEGNPHQSELQSYISDGEFSALKKFSVIVSGSIEKLLEYEDNKIKLVGEIYAARKEYGIDSEEFRRARLRRLEATKRYQKERDIYQRFMNEALGRDIENIQT